MRIVHAVFGLLGAAMGSVLGYVCFRISREMLAREIPRGLFRPEHVLAVGPVGLTTWQAALFVGFLSILSLVLIAGGLWYGFRHDIGRSTTDS